MKRLRFFCGLPRGGCPDHYKSLRCGLWTVVCGLFLSGCTVWKPMRVISPASLPESRQTYYDYPKTDLHSNVVLEEKKNSYLMRRVEFPLTLPEELQVPELEKFKKEISDLEKVNPHQAREPKLRYTNRIDFYVPKNWHPGEKRPTILISPILGGNMVVDRFAAYYTGRGYVAAIVHRKKMEWDETQDIHQVENYLRASVIRLRQALDWLEVQPEVDPKKIGGFGISYGAILHTALAAVDDRIRYHVLAMPGGPLPEVIMNCPEKQIVKLLRGVRQKYGWKDDFILSELQKSISTEPLQLASYISRDKVQVYIALFDHVVGRKHSMNVWRALGKPQLKILPFGHYGGVLVFPLLETQSYWAFKKHFR